MDLPPTRRQVLDHGVASGTIPQTQPVYEKKAPHPVIITGRTL